MLLTEIANDTPAYDLLTPEVLNAMAQAIEKNIEKHDLDHILDYGGYPTVSVKRTTRMPDDVKKFIAAHPDHKSHVEQSPTIDHDANSFTFLQINVSLEDFDDDPVHYRKVLREFTKMLDGAEKPLQKVGLVIKAFSIPSSIKTNAEGEGSFLIVVSKNDTAYRDHNRELDKAHTMAIGKNEEKWVAEAIAVLKKNKCYQYINDDIVVTYRGMDNGGPVMVKESRKNRMPTDTAGQLHKLLDKWFKKNLGHPYRSNAVFVTKDSDMALDYGRPYVIFPVGDNVKCAYSPKVRDLFQDLEDLPNDMSYKDVDRVMSKKEYREIGFGKYLLQNGANEAMVKCDKYVAIDAHLWKIAHAQIRKGGGD